MSPLSEIEAGVSGHARFRGVLAAVFVRKSAHSSRANRTRQKRLVRPLRQLQTSPLLYFSARAVFGDQRTSVSYRVRTPRSRRRGSVRPRTFVLVQRAHQIDRLPVADLARIFPRAPCFGGVGRECRRTCLPRKRSEAGPWIDRHWMQARSAPRLPLPTVPDSPACI